MRIAQSRFINWLLLTVIALAGGCQRTPSRASVRGQVVFEDGQLVDRGMIEFAPLEGTPVSSGAVIQAGHYEIPAAKGLAIGKYRVRISQPEQLEAPAAGPPGSVRHAPAKELVAAKFNSETELVAEVVDLADQQFDYRVEHR